jgi:hypothetical protein
VDPTALLVAPVMLPPAVEVPLIRMDDDDEEIPIAPLACRNHASKQ